MIETHPRILGIAPYDGMRTAMEQAAQAYPNVEMDIYTGDLEDGQAIVQQMPPNSYDCIISRGGTAALIRQVTDLPVVDIHISVYDVLRTMKLAENYSSLYAIVGFPSITEPAHTLCSLLDFNLDILTVNNAADAILPVSLPTPLQSYIHKSRYARWLDAALDDPRHSHVGGDIA